MSQSTTTSFSTTTTLADTTTTTTHRKPQPSTKSAPKIHSSISPTFLPPTVSTLNEAFATDPVFTYLFNNIPSGPARDTARLKALQFLLSAQAANRGICYSATSTKPTSSTTTSNGDTENTDAKDTGDKDEPNFHTAAAILPPNAPSSLPLTQWLTLLFTTPLLPLIFTTGLTPLYRFLTGYAPGAERAKALAFNDPTPSPSSPSSSPTSAELHKGPRKTWKKSKGYYYISHIGTLASYRGQGLAPAVIRDLQVKARDEGVPIWLEASSLGSRKVYSRCGFVDVGSTDGGGGAGGDGEPIVLGVGECDECGEKAEGDKAVGIRAWPMVWWP